MTRIWALMRSAGRQAQQLLMRLVMVMDEIHACGNLIDFLRDAIEAQGVGTQTEAWALGCGRMRGPGGVTWTSTR